MNLNKFMVDLVESVSFSYSKESSRLNQDSILSPKPVGDGYIFAVADGVGSYEGGALASAIAIEQVERFEGYNKPFKVDEIFNLSRSKIIELYEEDDRYSRAATTLTFCFVDNDGITVGHIGDCRLYLKDGFKLKQLTKDHTQYQQLIDEGMFTKTFLKDKKAKNILTSAIAKDVDMTFDCFFVPYDELPIENGFLMAYIMSDGSHEFWEKRPRFSPNTMNSSVNFVRSLRDRVERAGPIDDFSIVGVKIQFSR